MQCALFYCGLLKQTFQHGALLLSKLAPHVTELSKVFQAGYFGLWTDENVHRTVHQYGFLQMNGNALQQVETFKYFGVVFTSDQTKGLIHELVKKTQFCVSFVPPGWRNRSFQRTQKITGLKSVKPGMSSHFYESRDSSCASSVMYPKCPRK